MHADGEQYVGDNEKLLKTVCHLQMSRSAVKIVVVCSMWKALLTGLSEDCGQYFLSRNDCEPLQRIATRALRLADGGGWSQKLELRIPRMDA